MKNFISTRTGEDGVVYGIIGLMILGALLFVVGYLFSFTYGQIGVVGGNPFIDPGFIEGSKTTINEQLKDGSYGSNLFTLMTGLIDNAAGTAAYGMCVTAMTGVAILFLVALIVIVILVGGFINEFIIPKIKNKKEKQS